MDGKTILYHNPRCSKSRATRALLEEQGEQPEIVEYLKTPPTAAELNKILDMLGLEPRELIRRKEKEYLHAGLDDMNLTRTELIEAMVKHPKLIERPIVIKDGRAVLGRPPEKVLDIL